MDFTEFKAFDNLNTEIIILNGDNFQLLWINDAAKAANWISDSSKFTEKTISSLLDEETGLKSMRFSKKLERIQDLLPSGTLKLFISLELQEQ